VSKGAKILILDDEPIVGDRLKPALEKCGYDVETQTSSQEAIDQLARTRYDVLITDLKMAGPSGLDVLRFVTEQSPSTSVIVITGYATAEQAKESLKGGAVDFIAKPFRISQLRELITRTLESRDGEPGSERG
jgi:DNA-binding NtrC family response regulator